MMRNYTKLEVQPLIRRLPMLRTHTLKTKAFQ